MEPLEPIEARPALREGHRRLVELLGGLSDGDWRRPTCCAGWAVKDVAAHLLDSSIRRLSLARDGWPPPPPGREIRSRDDLIAFLNALNAEWVAVARRFSPGVLVDLIAWAGAQECDYFDTLDPAAEAAFAVAWAGEERSENWFDIARELTEKWHHQQQIRDAVGAEALDEPELLGPVLDTFMRGLPFAFRDLAAPAGVCLRVEIEGPAGGEWLLERSADAWRLGRSGAAADGGVTLDQDSAWRLFTRGLAPDEARRRARRSGDLALTEPLFGFLGVMA